MISAISEKITNEKKKIGKTSLDIKRPYVPQIVRRSHRSLDKSEFLHADFEWSSFQAMESV